jgi:mRNA-degrading endonuclease RelE of RelBE toxin-antitoxin system
VYQLSYSKRFDRDFRKLSVSDQTRTRDALKEFYRSISSGFIRKGHGFKKIGREHYELRVDIRIRIIMTLDGDTFVCHLAGNHEDVRAFLLQ